nr:Os05g0179050 [Ipomoea trifida]
MARSLSVPAAKTPPSTSDPLSSLISLTVLISLNLCVGRALIDSSVAPLIPFISSRTPRNDMIHGRQQHIIAHKMKGIAYPIQLKDFENLIRLTKKIENFSQMVYHPAEMNSSHEEIQNQTSLKMKDHHFVLY